MKQRRGVTLVEVMAAAAILAALMALTGEFIVTFVAHHRQCRREDLALRESANVMRLAEQVPFAELSADSIVAGCTEFGVVERVRGQNMSLHVTVDDGRPSRFLAGSVPLVGRKVTSTVIWEQQGRTRQVQLVLWRLAPSQLSPAPDIAL